MRVGGFPGRDEALRRRLAHGRTSRRLFLAVSLGCLCSGFGLGWVTADSTRAGLAPAQQNVVPAQFSTTDAPALGWFAGLTTAMRQQIIIGSRHLRGLASKPLVGFWLRRDAGYSGALSGGAVDLEIWVSNSTSLDPDGPSPRFDVNHGPNKLLVFKGRVSIPASPAISSYQPWSPQNSVRIRFTKSLVYTGGSLCIECRGQPVATARTKFWPVDYDLASADGTVTEIGTSCTKVPITSPNNASAEARSLRIGATAMFTVRVRPSTRGVFLLGSQLHRGGAGINLDPIKAKGCTLYVVGLAAIPFAFGAPLEPGAPTHATARLSIPNATSFLGATLFGQWADIEWSLPPAKWTNAAGFTMSNAVRARISPVATTAGLATITRVASGSSLPPEGTVHVATAPVLKLMQG